MKPVALQVAGKVSPVCLLQGSLFSCPLCGVAVGCLGPDPYLV